MLFIFSTPDLIRNLWQLKTAIFLHWCLICVVPLHWAFVKKNILVEKQNSRRNSLKEPTNFTHNTMNFFSFQSKKVFTKHFNKVMTLGLLAGKIKIKVCNIYIESLKNRLLKVCYVPATSTGLPRVSVFFSFLFLLLRPFTVLMKQTRQAVCAIKQSIFLDVYGMH